MDKELLVQFLLSSNMAGYAGGEEKQWIKESDGSTTIPFREGAWCSHDNFFGGEPYGGRVVVFYENKPYWMMVYYGWVEGMVESKPIYEVLQHALMEMPQDYPYRGPEKYEEGDYVYSNSWQGEVDRFSGSEQITKNGVLVYKADYLGGLVDQRNWV
ncbi:hypothetical protein A3B02_01735 [Candidatus Roizmanbacteria bacterium RIFCSPLOWO2_01_FULL_42_14]|uniref:DUF5680 domain-containing protein n=2 Tax=Candidatus Roizmaniibacteriota TaxID=1752723 RepID=A0A1F7J7H5_9BACT|nr:MAG: hypothetical protein A3F32_01715 [Candidatus Roizmanbacteria bacterium RIFCSPHIGHO2_12_FULL_42_10]OGK51558.1 MAG: hypothetical protein A3B02_01735 [Candidatus Roizmanbacteria bacterium RIFCSPLOWO2_01_FULL_42_14]